jgi:hypothetical protein
VKSTPAESDSKTNGDVLVTVQMDTKISTVQLQPMNAVGAQDLGHAKKLPESLTKCGNLSTKTTIPKSMVMNSKLGVLKSNMVNPL